MTTDDKTNDPALKSWLVSANQPDCHFPIQNLPFGVFTTAGKPEKRVGVAIGDQILDLSVLEKTWLIPISKDIFSAPDINRFMSLGPKVWAEVRAVVSALLDASSRTLQDDEDLRALALVSQADATLHMPVQVGDYTDFYASKEHATNVGTMFRDPDNALMPNWLHIPIGYNGRASTVVASGTDIHRPLGQIKPPGSDGPIFDACRKLDMELEIAAIVGTSNPMGQPITVDQANEMIFGYVILNDWSARDIQVWEYQPLGPFQAKAFASTISPWVVTRAAMEPFRQAGPVQDPEPLPYLRQKAGYNYNLKLQVTVQPEAAAKATTICKTNFKYMYWSSPQQLAHHAACGCAMRSGDLLGSGTISGQDKDSLGSFLELSWNGQNPMTLDGGESRTFIEDGDTISMTGWCQGDGYRIGFGDATGKILPAVQHPSLKEM
ncbi:MAG: fumarylacetoacetase [Sneathiella sp.]|nr:fumarylacetoacetase [Sneathiella sp.]